MANLVIRTLVLLLVGLLLAAAGWTWLTLHWSYSEGERAGYVQKFSKKGWLCKTWEGEIALVTMPGAIPEKFEFTVKDDAVAKRINDLAGRRVVLSYQQHKFIPVSCYGETEYFVVDIKPVDEPHLDNVLPASPAPALNP
ncbi:hypothetical protein EZJ19_09440 [Parasulfuritortus cantonensis]|uniref:6-phosphogluconate dehydrogenase n=1 Tax=Parasulfuritortus cantonensis TaxID=2528202 RepID=A0A4R1BC93_9PROT|nr:hypothetical protein [Parasulfuritortus cantonensis]TCJ14661.1 hypothetical protein EZJ19_09440 [Parasulfuritortus cantonensis]